MAVYVALVGAPSTGKTALLNELAKRGHAVAHEVSRQLIEEQRAIGGSILPQINRDAFQREILKRQIVQRVENAHHSIVFCDTSIPCGIAYYRADGAEAPGVFLEAAREHSYDVVLLIDLLPFYEDDGLRIENKESAKKIQGFLRDVHAELGHKIIEVPFMSVAQRADFIEKALKDSLNI